MVATADKSCERSNGDFRRMVDSTAFFLKDASNRIIGSRETVFEKKFLLLVSSREHNIIVKNNAGDYFVSSTRARSFS